MKIDAGETYLRKIEITDVEDIFEYAQDKDTGPMAGWPPHENIETTKEIVTNWLKPECNEMVLGVVCKENNKVIGTVGITYINKHEKDTKNIFLQDLMKQGKNVYEIGTTISKEYWGRGVATSTLKATIYYLFKETNADVVVTCHFESNIGSKKVQDKVNMKLLGKYERDKKWYNTDCTTMWVRGKTREDWIHEQ